MFVYQLQRIENQALDSDIERSHIGYNSPDMDMIAIEYYNVGI